MNSRKTEPSDSAQLEILNTQVTPADVTKLRELATDLQLSYKATVEKYYDLCLYVREKQISPDVLLEELRKLGFADSRISEIKRVSFSTKEIFEDYKAKTIGFKLALEKSRDEVRKKSSSKQDELLKARDAFEIELRSVIEKHIPAAGKLPRWFPFIMVAQGCDISISVKRSANKE